MSPGQGMNKDVIIIALLFLSGILLVKQSIGSEFGGCNITELDAARYPWSVGLRIRLPNENDAYWPAVIIGPHTLITDGRTFRAPNRKLRILSPSNYSISLRNAPVEDEQGYSDLKVSYIRSHPKIGASIEYWMKAEHDFVLIHLRHPINFTQTIRPLCLPDWDEAYWEEKSSQNESYVDPDTNLIITGWTCKYYYSLAEQSAGFDYDVKSYEICEGIWANQPEYSSLEGVEYKNRICGMPKVRKADANYSSEDLDPGFCGEKGYYATGMNGDKRILLGKFNGFGQRVFANPTGYVQLLTPSLVEWIQNSMKCGAGDFACTNGDCISLDQRCDKVSHCADSSDEDRVYCRSLNHCATNEFECGVYGPCIPIRGEDGKEAANCDGVNDCPNGEDEDAAMCLQPDPSWFSRNWSYVIGSCLVLIIMIVLISVLIARRNILKRRLYLSEAEILEFRQGISSSLECVPIKDDGIMAAAAGEDAESHMSLTQLPYFYEDIAKEKFKFDAVIGGGAFGDVYKGSVGGKVVAIKMLKKGSMEKEEFKTFLDELKIMAFVNFVKGGHKNVIKLVGAYTAEIRNLELYIALEFCEHGSIIDYLKQNKADFKDVEEDKPDEPVMQAETKLPSWYIQFASIESSRGRDYCSVQVSHRRAYLNQWICEIIEGMQFLSSRNIVHGDLAARNILLDSNLTAKISDFGLSRQIYCYNLSGAQLDKNAQLPWRWMAPEVLTNMKMSPLSDVWSFGIVAWELYTLGGVPYGGLEWNPSFNSHLKNGLKLLKPEYASEELFKIIQTCWTYSPRARPCFDCLHSELNALFQMNPGAAGEGDNRI